MDPVNHRLQLFFFLSSSQCPSKNPFLESFKPFSVHTKALSRHASKFSRSNAQS